VNTFRNKTVIIRPLSTATADAMGLVLLTVCYLLELAATPHTGPAAIAKKGAS
jgi:hypothetical protein